MCVRGDVALDKSRRLDLEIYLHLADDILTSKLRIIIRSL